MNITASRWRNHHIEHDSGHITHALRQRGHCLAFRFGPDRSLEVNRSGVYFDFDLLIAKPEILMQSRTDTARHRRVARRSGIGRRRTDQLEEVTAGDNSYDSISTEHRNPFDPVPEHELRYSIDGCIFLYSHNASRHDVPDLPPMAVEIGSCSDLRR